MRNAKNPIRPWRPGRQPIGIHNRSGAERAEPYRAFETLGVDHLRPVTACPAYRERPLENVTRPKKNWKRAKIPRCTTFRANVAAVAAGNITAYLKSAYLKSKQLLLSVFAWKLWVSSFRCAVIALHLMGGGPRVVVSTAAFHARVRGSVPGLAVWKKQKCFFPNHVWKSVLWGASVTER